MNFDLVTSFSLLFVILFYAMILFIGILTSRSDNKSCDNLILADRKLPLWVGMLTMTATWVGGGYINGTAESVATTGLLWTQAPWGYAIALLLGGLFFAKKMREGNHITMLDPFAKAYGEKIAAVLFIPALIGEICWSAAILTALGATFSILFNIDLGVAIIASSTIAIAYTYLGGMKAVAYTDTLQLGIIFIGLFLVLPFLFNGLPNLTTLFNNYHHVMGDAAYLLPRFKEHTPWIWLDNAGLLMLGGIPWGVYFQRVLASRSGKQAQHLSYYAAIGCLVLAIAPILIGMVAATTDWAAIGLQTPAPANTLTAVIKYLTPTWVAIIALGAISAAVMSSVDSSILSVSSLFTWNIYQPLIYKRGYTRFELSSVIRFSILIFGALAIALALTTESVYNLWFLCSDLVYVVLFPQLVALFYFKDKSQQAVVTALTVGVILRLAGGEPAFSLPALLPYPEQFPLRTFAMLSSMILLYLVPKLQGSRQQVSTNHTSAYPNQGG